MGHELGNLFYRNGRLTALAVSFVLVAGLAALQTLARQEDPTMTERFGSVETYLPGATAQRVEALVTERIEAKLREIPEVDTVASTSRAGFSFVDVDLDDSVDQPTADIVWSEVRDKLGELASELPSGASAPEVVVRGPVATTIAVALTWRGEGEPQLNLLTRLAEDLQLRLANLAGTKETELFGETEEEMLVAVDPRALAAIAMTAEEVAAVIAASDTKNAAGSLRGAGSDLLVEVMGELDSVERIGSIPLGQRADGQFVRVADVARVSKAAVNPPATIALADGQRSVVVTAVMETDRRVDLWAANARDLIADFRAEMPVAIGLEIIFDQNAYTSDRLGTLLVNLITALAIVMLVLVLFMGLRSALTVGVALPLTMAMVLGGLRWLDIPLHQMSVTGLIISLGLLIDNAIVVVEEFKLMRRRDHAISAAIAEAVRHLFVPLLASTATTVFAFMPVAMTPGGTGEFTGTIAVSVILSVSSSFLLAMTVVPAVAGFVDRRFPPRPREADQHAPWWIHGFSHPVLLHRYRRSLDVVLTRPRLGLAAGLILPLLGFALAGTLTQQFFPPVDRDQFQIQLSLPAQSSIAETHRAVERMRTILREYPTVVEDHFFLGEAAPRVYYNVILKNDGLANFAGAFVRTTGPEATRALLPNLQRRLAREFPNARVLALPFEQGPPFDAPIEVRIVGDDLEALKALGERVRLILAGTDGVTYTDASLAGAEPKVAVYPDLNRAAQAGVAMADLPRQLNAGLLGARAGTVMEGTHELPVRVRYRDSERSELDQLAALPVVASRDGDGYRGIPLDQLARFELKPAANSIQHYQGERINTVQGFLEPFTLPAAALSSFEQRLQVGDLALPSGYRIEFGGEAEQRSESVGNLVSTFALFLLLMVAVVVLSLNSFRQAGIIGLVGLLSIGLALFGVRLFGYPFGFMAMIGTLGLVGLAINGAIIVLSALRADPAAARGEADAAREVVVDATRHIVSTTVTTIGGFLPLILFGGTFWPPLATAIAGGVAGSAILALYMVPAIYVAQARRAAAAGVDTEVTEAPSAPTLRAAS